MRFFFVRKKVLEERKAILKFHSCFPLFRVLAMSNETRRGHVADRAAVMKQDIKNRLYRVRHHAEIVAFSTRGYQTIQGRLSRIGNRLRNVCK